MKKLICGLIVFCTLAIPLFAGGGGQQQSTDSGSQRVKLSYWEDMDRAVNGHKSFATHPVFMELQKRLNVDLEFRHPPAGNVAESFNLMVASRDLPDIITYNWFQISGGVANYIKDDVIIPLDDVFSKYAPALKKVFEKYPAARRESSLDDGTHYCFPLIYADPIMIFGGGPMFRRDLLNKIPGIDGSKVPMEIETLDDWEKLFLAVKNSGLKGDSGNDIIPLLANVGGDTSFTPVGAFGINTRFSQNNGKVVYGPADPRYLDYLTLMKRWYDLGILDREFAANNARLIDEKVLDNRVFFFYHYMGNGITRYTGLARATNPNFLLNIARVPVLKKGELASSGRSGLTEFARYGAAITTACKNVETAARLLDYNYTDEGYILTNFGIEGVHFTWDTDKRKETKLVFSAHAGYPKYSDIIMNNPSFTPDVAMSVYVTANNMSYGFKSPEFLEQRDGLPEQVGAMGRVLWTMEDDSIILPAITPTTEESAEFGRIMNAINTYTDEMSVKFVTGVEPLSRFNEYVQTQKRMGLDRAIALVQAQLDRYNTRP
jgi:putative aldouronate transport system substrate-binding protein